jgi:hypothetical protein
MSRRPLNSKDVVQIAHKHFQEKNKHLGSNLVIYVLDTLKSMSDDEAVIRLRSLGYQNYNVAEDAVRCARNCVTFSEALVQQGYAWDDWMGRLAPPLPKVV